jgi:hypothetical protein
MIIFAWSAPSVIIERSTEVHIVASPITATASTPSASPALTCGVASGVPGVTGAIFSSTPAAPKVLSPSAWVEAMTAPVSMTKAATF